MENYFVIRIPRSAWYRLIRTPLWGQHLVRIGPRLSLRHPECGRRPLRPGELPFPPIRL